MISTKDDHHPNPSTIQRIPRRLLLEDQNLWKAQTSDIESKYFQAIKKRNPKIWKFHLGDRSSKHSKAEITFKILAMAMKSPKKAPEEKSYFASWTSGTKRLYYLNSGLKKFSSLRNLDLQLKGRYNIGDKGLEDLCGGLKRLNSLQSLSLRFISISNKNVIRKRVQRLSKCLRRLTGLKDLSLGFPFCEEITDDDLKYLGGCLRSLLSLESFGLDLSHCSNITNSGISCLNNGLKKLVNLKSLNLGFAESRKITDEGVKEIEEILSSLHCLEKVELRFWKGIEIGNAGLIGLSKGIGKLPLLKEVDIYCPFLSNIGDPGINELGKVLKDLKDLSNIKVNLYGMRTPNEKPQDFFSQADLSKGPNLYFRARISDRALVNLGKNLLESFPFRTINLCFINSEELSAAGLRHFGKSLNKLVALENFRLSFTDCTKIASSGFLSLCESMQDLKDLQNFSLGIVRSPCLVGLAMEKFCEILKGFPVLKSFSLNFDFPQLGAKGLIVLCETLKSLDSLESVFLKCDLSIGLSINGFSLNGQREIKKYLHELAVRLAEAVGKSKQEALKAFHDVMRIMGNEIEAINRQSR